MRIHPRMASIAAAFAGLLFLGACDVDQDGEPDTAEFEQSAKRIGEELADAATYAGEAAESAGEEIEAFFARWDEDADRAFERIEFERWWNQANPFDAWDADGDEELSESEWEGVIYLDLEALDADENGIVTRAEMRDGLFEALDENGDGALDRSEFDRIEL